ncbi:heme-binding domain-containing protein [Aquimarina brevivitae]|uniref:Heme-binding protein n=1 Tax=Aquimarina brevivitae TaxID=323412 RepID=A0A4Q7P1H7_9FLAO|nr:heme-binding domain-containing protein [Aquimarina brevivitae]RZS93168.1 heme-binding protein [Aquimarina brevivitae]
MKKVGKIIGGVLLIALVIIQFIRPKKNQQGYESVVAFEAETQSTEEIKTILRNNCYDCHSNQTTYPWYAEIAPVSYWLNDHIEEGKEHFNVSEWESYSVKRKDHKLEELEEEVEEGHMPLDSYTWLHGDLTKDQQTALIEWAKKSRKALQAKK